jgi:AraC family transcriptional activator of pobA
MEDWRLSLLHDDPFDLLIWVTHRQGLLHNDGSRRGLGAQSAIFFHIDRCLPLIWGGQANGLVAIIPPIHNSWDIEKTHQLRTRDAKQIAQLSGFFEAAQREIPDDQSFF